MEAIKSPDVDAEGKDPLFCRNCSFFKFPGLHGSPECVTPTLRRINLVTGFYGPSCHEARSDGGGCGPAGDLFLSRDHRRNGYSQADIANASQRIADTVGDVGAWVAGKSIS